VEQHLEAFRLDMERDVSSRINEIDTILLEMLQRADEFLSDRLTVGEYTGAGAGGGGGWWCWCWSW
jgi:hypothetical protein